ncbi:pimeloyl-ACP methyl ester carboxylesterase [Providencia alcalifaciens]|uniref:Pimeloyl-ACP methyl ester carboxylesterase n=1 Tax=Providencia alcalifaciens TaxID=126385 RepID=A0A4R3NZY3_9GAMM|nr:MULTISPECIES: alpha/beta fold hydrolase [Providencia]MBC5790242.1 alpha/beta fold hydrolase [Providencia sp. JUb39]TCT38770.1 pimeloyl-ACP methyl ester carboxylesterase [Providencia alcalifaciens]
MREIKVDKLTNGISATLRTENLQGNSPVVILCHGFGGIQEILLPAFADAFLAAGFSVITFDYLGFGVSDGERGRLVPALQIDNIVNVIDWAKSLPSIDNTKIALWGTSLGGGHVFGAAVKRPELKCIISQLSFADGEKVVTGNMTQEDKRSFCSTLNKMVEKRENTGKEMFVPITKVLSDCESKAFFDANKDKYPLMDIKIPFLTVQEMMLYKPYESARNINLPVMIVVAGKDIVNPPEQGIELYNAVGSDDKLLYVEDDASHYDVYEGKCFDNVIIHQIEFLNKYLK